MNSAFSFKAIVLSAIFLVILLIEATLIDYLLGLILDNFAFKVINWFNEINIFWKIVTIFLGGATLFFIVLQLVVKLSFFINFFLFKYFPGNLFITISSFIIFIANLILGLKILWDSFPSFDFWLFIEFVALGFFVYAFNSVLLIRSSIIED